MDSRRLDWWTRIWLGCAALWCVGLVAAGLFVNSYATTNGPGDTNAPGGTLVQVNGDKVLVVMLIPLASVVIVYLALRHRRRARLAGVGVLVWVVFGLLALFVLLGAFTVGPFVAPVVVFVILSITRVKSQSLESQRAFP